MDTATEMHAPARAPARRLLDHLRRRSRRRAAIRELRAMPSYRLADLGLSRGQIPEFVDALLEQHAPSRAPVAPSEVREALVEVLLGPWADGASGRAA